MMQEEEPESVQTNGVKLTEAERREFDNITYDAIHDINDMPKLKKMETYFRLGGYEPTAQAVRKHMADLGLKDPVRDPEMDKEARMDLEGFRNSLKAWTAEAKQADKDFLDIKSAGGAHGVSMGAPPPRPPGTISVAAVKDKQGAKSVKPADTAKDQAVTEAPGQPRPDSKFGGQVRSGADYYRKWDQFADKAVEEAGDNESRAEEPRKAQVPGVKAPAGGVAAASAGGAGGVSGSGAVLTQRILEANAGLAPKERVWNAEQEKAKGNECFRAKEYAQAVERYTLSLGYNPDNAGVYGNRAAAYFKLKMYPEVVADCDSALALDKGFLKGYVRRAAARMELGQAKQAMEDIESGLALEPGHKELSTMQQRAAKALGLSGMKRMAIQEVDDDDEDDDVGGDVPVPVQGRTAPVQGQMLSQGHVQGQAAPSEPAPRTSHPGGTQRTRIPVVEESDSDTDEQQGLPESKVVQPQASKVQQPPAQMSKVDEQARVLPSPARPTSRKTKIAVVEEDSDDDDVVQDGGKYQHTAQAPTATKQPGAADLAKPASTAKDAKKPAEQAKMPADVKVSPVAAPVTSENATAKPALSKKAAAKAAKAAAAAVVAEQPAAPAATAQTKPAATPAAQSAPAVDAKPSIQGSTTAAQPTAKAPAQAPAPSAPVPAHVTSTPPTASAAAIPRAPAAAPVAPTAVQVPLAILTLEEEAANLKAQGNRLLVADDLVRAIDVYTKALELQPDSAILYTNRALAKLKLNDAKGCLNDAAQAVALDPSYAKAMHKRAQAKAKLGLYQAAKEDLVIAQGLAQTDSLQEQIAKARAEVESDLAAHLRARQAARSRAQAGKVTQYKGGVTIEEHSDEEEETGAQLSSQQVARIESDATAKSHRLRKQAEQKRLLRQAQIEEQQQQQVVAAAAAKQAAAAAGLQSVEAAVTEQAAAVQASVPGSSQQQQAAAASQPAPAESKVSTGPSKVAAEPSKVAPEASKVDQASADELKETGRQLYSSRDLTGACAAWSRALTVAPEGSAVARACLANLSLVLQQLGDAQGALGHADALLKLEPENEKGLHRRALALSALGRLAESMEAYRAAQLKSPMSATLMNEMTDLAERIKRERAYHQPTSASPEATPTPAPSFAPSQASTAAPVPVTHQETFSGQAAHSATPATAPSAQPAAPVTAAGKKIAIQEEDEQGQDQNAVVSEQDVTIDLTSIQEHPARTSSQATATANETPATELTDRDRQATADGCREAGNELFKQNQLPEALAAYNQSLEAFETAAAHANKALVLLKLGRASEAETACRAALALEPSHVKAQFRLAKALQQVDRLEEAVPLFEQIHAVRNDKESRDDLAAAKRELLALRQKQAAATAAAAAASTTSSRHPAPVRQKIQIEETCSDASEDEQEGLTVPVGMATQGSAAAAHPAANGAKADSEARRLSPAVSQGGTSSTSSRRTSGSGSISSSKLQQVAAARAAAAIANLASKRPAPPKSAVDFTNGCKLIGDDNELLADYVASIEPSSYPSLFKQSLDNSCLSHMLRALNHIAKENAAFAFQALTHLPAVSRFSMVYTMLPRADKAVAAEILNKAAAAGLKTDELKPKFGIKEKAQNV